MVATIVSILLLLGSVAHAEDAASAFPNFCEEWMEKLAAREHANVAHIKWETGTDGVRGDYVGYTREHTCLTKEGSGAVPIGKIMYRELRYEKRGGTIAEAERCEPHPVEATEVTEIFRYAKGKWVY